MHPVKMMLRFCAFAAVFLAAVFSFHIPDTQAQDVAALQNAAANFRADLMRDHRSSRNTAAIKTELDREYGRRYPHRYRIAELRREYIASGETSTEDWLMLMRDASALHNWWRDNAYHLPANLPDSRDVWEPAENEIILSGFSALAAAENDKERNETYRELMLFLKAFNDHPQAGKGGYKLFALEAELARRLLQGNDVPLRRVAQERIKTLETLLTQKVLRSEEKTDSDAPQLCLHFRLPLPERGVRYEDYIRIAPHTKITAIPLGESELCLRGLDYAADYDIRILAGVPTSLRIGRAMEEDYTQKLNFGDRAPLLRMAGGRYILARDAAQGIPVESVNIEKMNIRIAKAVTERALPHGVQALDNQLYRYQFGQYFHATGEPVWSGEMDVKSVPNRSVTTYFPIEEVLAEPEPGIYAIEAEYRRKDDNRVLADARQFFVVTDIGLTTLTAENGLYVFSRSLKTAKPAAGVKLQLISRNNTVLGEGVTDQDGTFRFPAALTKGRAGLAPLLATAKRDNDFALIRLDTAGYDFSDRGVSGRAYPGPVDAFAYTDRGIYRPGETVRIVALARDSNGDALPDLPLTLKVRRSDNVMHLERSFDSTALGGVYLDMELPANARMGTWTASVYADPSAPPVGSVSFRIEEYVPPRITAEIDMPDQEIFPGTVYHAALQSDYLYGAPAAGLAVSSEVVLLKDDAPFPDYRNFTFGLAQEDYTPQRYPLPQGRTDENGAASVKVSIAGGDFADLNVPLKARIRTSVFEKGGRAVSAVVERPFRHRQTYLGLREAGTSDSGQRQFEIVALGADGEERTLDGVEVTFVRENYYYNWFSNHQGWQFRRQYFDEALERNIVSVTEGERIIVEAPEMNRWWPHRVEIVHSATGAAASLRIDSYWGERDEDTPDTVTLAAKSGTVAAGRNAEIAVKPPYGGEALVTVVNDKLLYSRNLRMEEGGATISVPVTEEWGPGAYVLVSVIRPAAEAAGRHDGTRAVGVAWIAVDRESKKLDVSFDIPDTVRPRGVFELPVSVAGLAQGEKAYLTVAAVDEGVLRLTDFKTPDPFGFYSGQRRLGAAMRDIYGQLLKGAEGHIGKIRSGGAAQRERSAADDAFRPETYIETVALFSGIIAPDENGQARILLDIPDFDGRLRLMAVAYSADKTGSGEADLTVRDPVIVQASLPRFLAPEDETILSLRLHNLDGAAGEYRLSLNVEGLELAAADARQRLYFAEGEEKNLALPLRALPRTGTAELKLSLDGPGDFSVRKNWRFAVRPYQILQTQSLQARIPPGESYEAPEIGEAYWPGTVTASAVAAPRNMPNISVLVDNLMRYAYGCTEQLVSTSLPLMHFDTLHEKWGLRLRDDSDLIKIRAAASVDRVMNNMRNNGNFGYWRAQDEGSLWLSSFASEYLLEARELGYGVPDSVMATALGYLKRRTQNPDAAPENLAAVSYALYVLAKAGEIDAGQLRYFYDSHAENLQTNWSLAMIGAALSRFGETERAEAAFAKALTRVEEDKPAQYWYFGSQLRNKAVLLALLAENDGLSAKTDDLFDRLIAAYDGQRYLSTQEQLWLTRAAVHMTPEQSEKIAFTFAPPPQMVQTEAPHNIRLAENADGVRSFTLDNTGDATIYLRLGILAAPREVLPAEEAGFRVTRRYYHMDGTPALEDGLIGKNTLLVAVIEGRSGQHQNRSGENLLIDMLPAGFELENADLAGGTGTDELGWLLRGHEITELVHTELRDDRYVAAFRGGEGTEFRAAYLVRAVTPGVYAHPGVYVEDMYHPGLYGRGESGTVTVTDDGAAE